MSLCRPSRPIRGHAGSHPRLACAVLAAATGCLPPLARDPDNVIDLRARMRSDARATSTATTIYRWAGQRSLAVTSYCQMAPTDSEVFAIRAERCGGVAAWYWGVSRLLLEQASSPKFARPIRLDGRLRWLDLAGPCR